MSYIKDLKNVNGNKKSSLEGQTIQWPKKNGQYIYWPNSFNIFCIFLNVLCLTVCDGGTYGPDCSQQCFCRDAVCDKVTGLCPGGCQEGYSGPNCNLGKSYIDF